MYLNASALALVAQGLSPEKPCIANDSSLIVSPKGLSYAYAPDPGI